MNRGKRTGCTKEAHTKSSGSSQEEKTARNRDKHMQSTKETRKRDKGNRHNSKELKQKTQEPKKEKKCIQFPRTALAGTGYIEVNEMVDSSQYLQDIPKLRKIFADTGYLLLRGFLPRDKVLSARCTILEICEDEGFLKAGTKAIDGICKDKHVSPGLLSRPEIAHLPEVLQVLEAKELFNFFDKFLEGKSVTAKYKWLRAVNFNKFTGVHIDKVYMGKGTPRLHTAWLPLGDIAVSQGTLLVCPGSHVCDQLKDLRSSYGTSTVGSDGTSSGWIAEDPNEIEKRYGKLEWLTTDFRMGDVCIVGLDLLHMSTTNTTDTYRLSCDLRFQEESESMDPRLCPFVRH
eukprot:TRINITY_DN6872_c0_g2_i1.p1 TRINITY_DN6872_c0_g2~~TRINITY_DN6872_c0_g2_i1.p1  ORF type:complete len:380 (-),score=54.46 TRINITY_DN6872_c0_g2_i1:329-1363(-)